MVDDDRFKWRWRPRKEEEEEGKRSKCCSFLSLSAKARKTGMRKASSLSFPNRIFLPLPLSLFAYIKIPCVRTLKILLFRLLTCVKKGKISEPPSVSLPPWENLFLLGGGTTRESYVAPHDVCALPPSPFLFGMQRRSSSVQKAKFEMTCNAHLFPDASQQQMMVFFGRLNN